MADRKLVVLPAAHVDDIVTGEMGIGLDLVEDCKMIFDLDVLNPFPGEPCLERYNMNPFGEFEDGTYESLGWPPFWAAQD